MLASPRCLITAVVTCVITRVGAGEGWSRVGMLASPRCLITAVVTRVITRVGAGEVWSRVGMLASPRCDQAIRLLHTQFCKIYHRNLPDIPMDGFFLASYHRQNVYLIHNFPWLNRRG